MSLVEQLEKGIVSKNIIFFKVNIDEVSECVEICDIKNMYIDIETYNICNKWIEKNIPNVNFIFFKNNVEGIIDIVTKSFNKKDSGAIGTDLSSTTFGIPLIENNIQNKDTKSKLIVISSVS